jgi:hypothetical protein
MIQAKIEQVDIDGENISIHEELWVADFGSPEIEHELKKEIVKLKPKSFKNFSWVFTSLLLIIIMVLGEYILWSAGLKNFWPILTITLVTWIYRLFVLLLWLYLAYYRWYLHKEKIVAVAFSSVILASIMIAIIKIILMPEAWAWLNILVEPIWALIMVSVVNIIFFKFSKK